MKRNTLEKGLLAWEPWRESVQRSRGELGFDPAWSDAKVTQWMADNYDPVIRKKGQDEVAALGLPPNFTEFWEDCLYNRYEDTSGRPHPERVQRVRTGRKSELPLPFKTYLSWDEDEDADDRWLTVLIQIHGAFCTRDLLDIAANEAWGTLAEHLRKNQIKLHPVAILARKVRPNLSERKRSARDRYLEGTASFEDLLREQWESAEIQRPLREGLRQSSIPDRRKRVLRRWRKTAYDRVRRWLGESAPHAARRGQWLEAMPEPKDV